MRVAGVIIKDGKILLMRRVKNGEEYFVFPGGGVEEDESLEEALEREIKEELGLDIKNYKKIFEVENRGVKEVYYLIFNFSGAPQLGGPEKERMNESNQYYLEWLELVKAAELKNLFPREAVEKLRRLPTTHPNPEYYKSLPRKRMAAGVIMFNKKEELLLVKPGYKDHWSVPGGIVDKDESPCYAAIREAKEEVGIGIKTCQLLCVDYNQAKGAEDERLEFIFFGGKLLDEEVSKIKVDGDEISEYEFFKTEDALLLLKGKWNSRLPKCLEALKNSTAIYLENGEEIGAN